MNVNKPNWYGGMLIYDPEDGQVIAASDAKFANEMKMLGGMWDEGDKDPTATAIREANEEGKTQVNDCTLVYVENIPGRHSRPDHFRYFHLADVTAGALAKDKTWEVEEKDKTTGQVLEKQIARWVPLREFASKLYSRQRAAFGAMLAELARRNPYFGQEYADLIRTFPAPANLGLGGKP